MMMQENELGGKLLASVSRSFYLTLKALPEGLREPLSMAYLLARAADTLADTSGIVESLKRDCLEEFGRLVQSCDRDEAGEAALCACLTSEFVPLQEDADEANLLQRLPEAFEAVRQYPERQLANIRGVLGPIILGQLLDIARFPVDGHLRALQTATELDDYTWMVAGCVGEFWTMLCLEELSDAFREGTDLVAQIQRGSRFGKGLQLVNILRDLGKDARMGRCYLPLEELDSSGVTIAEVQLDLSRLQPLLPKWQNQCREHLLAGIDYMDAVEHKRLRYATSLPLLLGVRTLALMEKATWEQRLAGVKVSRGEMTKIMFDAGIASLRQGGIRKLAENLAGKIRRE